MRGIACTLCIAALGLACSQPANHVLYGWAYSATTNCFNNQSSIAIVDGPAPTTPCPATCVTDVNGNVFVTTMCPPYPPLDTMVTADAAMDPACVAALTLFVSPPDGPFICGTSTGTMDGGADATSDGGSTLDAAPADSRAGDARD